MRSRDKFAIELRDNGGKVWAHCINPTSGESFLVPSFEDLFRMQIAIARCEEMKYGEFADRRSPRDLPLRFMRACAEVILAAPSLPLTYRAPLTVVGGSK